MSAPQLNNIHFTNPKLWSKRNKIIAAVVAAVLALVGITTFGVKAHIQYQKDCQARLSVLKDQMPHLDSLIRDADTELKSTDESIPFDPNGGYRLSYTDGFAATTEGQGATNALNDAIHKAEDIKKMESGEGGQQLKCLSQKELTDAEATIQSVEDQTTAFKGTRDAYRLSKATEDANAKMDAAKNNLTQAQQAADEQLKAADAAQNNDGSVRLDYIDLKSAYDQSQGITTEVKAGNLHEVMDSITSTDFINKTADDLKKKTETLKNTLDSYNAAQASRASAASASPNRGSRNSGSAPTRSRSSQGSTSGSQSRSYSNGGGSSYSGGGSGSTSGSSNSGGSSNSSSADEFAKKYGVSDEEANSGRYSYCVYAGNGRQFCS